MEGINDESNPEKLPQWHSNTPLALIGSMLCIQHNNIKTIGETETPQPSDICKYACMITFFYIFIC